VTHYGQLDTLMYNGYDAVGSSIMEELSSWFQLKADRATCGCFGLISMIQDV
jgi:hypothetical protein